MVVLAPGDTLQLRSAGGARAVLVGGDPLGERHMFWNFVSDSRERIEQAKDDWRARRKFPGYPDDDEFIPAARRRVNP
jgi:redox-sensitive bicupin YhaK (pirin superfamily)